MSDVKPKEELPPLRRSTRKRIDSKGKKEVADSDEEYIDVLPAKSESYIKKTRPRKDKKQMHQVRFPVQKRGRQVVSYEFQSDDVKNTKTSKVRLLGIFKKLLERYKLTGAPFVFTTIGAYNEVLRLDSPGAMKQIEDAVISNRQLKKGINFMSIEDTENLFKESWRWAEDDPRAPVSQKEINAVKGNDDDGYSVRNQRVVDRLSVSRLLSGLPDEPEEDDKSFLEVITGH
jgi:hypothetical protein